MKKIEVTLIYKFLEKKKILKFNYKFLEKNLIKELFLQLILIQNYKVKKKKQS